MAHTKNISYHYKKQLAAGKIDFYNDIFKVMLLTSSCPFDPELHVKLNDVQNYEISHNIDYQNPMTLQNVSHTNINNQLCILWADVYLGILTTDLPGFRHVVFYDHSNSEQTIIASISYTEDVIVPAGECYQFRNINMIIG